MASGDLYRIVDDQIWLDQEVLNIYYYLQSSGAGGAAELAEAFDTDILVEVVDIQNSDLQHQRLVITNLDNLLDFGIFIPTNSLGTLVGASMPPYVAWAFRLNRTSRATRHGQKRYAGVTEDAVLDGEASAGILPALVDVGAALDNVIEDLLANNSWIPQIVREPDDPLLRILNPVASASFISVSSQNTRKFGRGA